MVRKPEKIKQGETHKENAESKNVYKRNEACGEKNGRVAFRIGGR